MIARSVSSSCVPDRSIATDTGISHGLAQGNPWRAHWKHALSLIYDAVACNGVQPNMVSVEQHGGSFVTDMSVPPSGGASERGAVELTDVTKRFGTMVAVDQLNLSVEPGEFLSLLGPSGCGKTTTLRMLAGFEQPDEGFIRISGEYVQGIPPYKRDVNTVFQAYALFPHMTVAENVAYGLRQKGGSRSPRSPARVSEALDMVKMPKLAERKPRQMSGGQQQRVAVARALVNRPSVLLLDEPLGALDRKLREEMQIELKLLQSQLGITFIFVTHDQEEAMSMSDRIAIMLEGHVEQLGDPETVYERPASAFVAGFIGRNNFWRGARDRRRHASPTTAPCSSVTRPEERGRQRCRRACRRSGRRASRSSPTDPGDAHRT